MSGNGHAANGFAHDPAPLRFIDPIVWQDQPVPERRWLVPNWIPMGTVTGLYGDGGIGKSLLLQQLLTATAIDSLWLGLLTASVKAIGVFCEDPEHELHIRQNDINGLYDCEFGDLENVRYLSRFGEDNLLMTFAGGRGELTPFFHTLLEEIKDLGVQCVGIDTVADTFGGNENDRGQVRQYVQGVLGRIAREINGAVIALAHPSRSGISTGTGDSGSTGWSNSFRARAFFHAPEVDEGQEPAPNERVLSRKKANYAVRDETIELRWQNGVFVPTKTATGIFATIERRTAERVFLDMLAKHNDEGRYVSDRARAGNFAPRVFMSRPGREGFKFADLHRAMETLFAEGKIRIEQFVNADRNKVSRIVQI